MACSRILVTLALAALVLALAAVPAAAQTTTQTPGGSGSSGGSIGATANTGPSGALTVGGGSPAAASPGVLSPNESGHDEFAEEPLPDTGGGEIAIAVGSLLAAGGLGMRFALKR